VRGLRVSPRLSQRGVTNTRVAPASPHTIARSVTGSLTLLTVNGHPDDETAEAGGVIARYAAEGKRIVCVVATRGELGSIVDPALATPENLADVGGLREAELARALAVLGPVEYRLLGYRDSGMVGTAENRDPRAFCRAELNDAVGRLVRVIREVRADVIVAPNRYDTSDHPDHQRAAEIAHLAFERAGDATAYPEQLSDGITAWAPSKLYEPVHGVGRRERLARARVVGGRRAEAMLFVKAAARWRPGRERSRTRMMSAQRDPTSRVDVGRYLDRRQAALAEFRSQFGPGEELLALTPEQLRGIHPTEDFALVSARSRIDLPEDDLFAGLASRDGQGAPG
jgi:mycothiol S-conjugate amidase